MCTQWKLTNKTFIFNKINTMHIAIIYNL